MMSPAFFLLHHLYRCFSLNIPVKGGLSLQVPKSIILETTSSSVSLRLYIITLWLFISRCATGGSSPTGVKICLNLSLYLSLSPILFALCPSVSICLCVPVCLCVWACMCVYVCVCQCVFLFLLSQLPCRYFKPVAMFVAIFIKYSQLSSFL